MPAGIELDDDIVLHCNIDSGISPRCIVQRASCGRGSRLVILDALFAGVFRHFSRKVLDFPHSAEVPPLPEPTAGQRYLLYLHVPYCVVLCPFCSFHRVRFRRDSAEHYLACLRREIRLFTDAGFHFGELYVGGGTPTVIPEELDRTLLLLRQLHPLTRISIETNPDDLTKDGVHRLRDAGVNRLSVGVQSFDDDLLREMQRYDKYGSGADMIDGLKRETGRFDTLNVDMIFNFPHQAEASLRRDLRILTDQIGVDQVSWHPLMEAAGTRRSMLRSMGRVDRSRERQCYELITEHMLAAGYIRSSAWCFSREPGLLDEYIVNHDEYVGLGSGAFSFLQGALWASTFSIGHYLQRVEGGGSGIVQRRVMALRDRMRYYLLMQLFGGALELDTAERRFGGGFRRTLWPELTALRSIRALRESEGRLVLTESGYYLWLMMMREFFTGVGRLRDEMRRHIATEQALPSNP